MKPVSKQEFEVEKNAKNKAFAFILSRGLLKEFAEFCSILTINNIDAFALCRELLYETEHFDCWHANFDSKE